PSNAGPSTMPDYASLASQGVNTLQNGVRVFAGQRGDPFYIDLGATFDTLNFRRNPPLLTPAEDANDDVNPFGIDMIGSLNVQTIAPEVPIMSMPNGLTSSLASSAGVRSGGLRRKLSVSNVAPRSM